MMTIFSEVGGEFTSTKVKEQWLWKLVETTKQYLIDLGFSKHRRVVAYPTFKNNC